MPLYISLPSRRDFSLQVPKICPNCGKEGTEEVIVTGSAMKTGFFGDTERKINVTVLMCKRCYSLYDKYLSLTGGSIVVLSALGALIGLVWGMVAGNNYFWFVGLVIGFVCGWVIAYCSRFLFPSGKKANQCIELIPDKDKLSFWLYAREENWGEMVFVEGGTTKTRKDPRQDSCQAEKSDHEQLGEQAIIRDAKEYAKFVQTLVTLPDRDIKSKMESNKDLISQDLMSALLEESNRQMESGNLDCSQRLSTIANNISLHKFDVASILNFWELDMMPIIYSEGPLMTQTSHPNCPSQNVSAKILTREDVKKRFKNIYFDGHQYALAFSRGGGLETSYTIQRIRNDEWAIILESSSYTD